MAVQIRQGTVALNTTTGNQSVTGLGGGWKAAIFWLTLQTADGFAAGVQGGIGWAVSSTGDRGVAWVSDDNETSSDTGRRRHTTRPLVLMDQGGALTTVLEVDFVSFDTDGFTVSVVTNSAAAGYQLHYLLLGGADVTNVAAGHFSSGTATGNVSVTGLGFQPNAGLLLTAGVAATSAAHAVLGLGAMLSTTKRGYAAWSSRDGVAAGIDGGTVQKTDRCIGWINPTSTGSIQMEADFVSWDSDGFTINVTTAPASAGDLIYLVWRGGLWDLGTITQPTSAGNVTFTSSVVQPKGALLWGVCRASPSTVSTGDTRYGISACDGSGNEAGAAWHEVDASDPTQVAECTFAGKVARAITGPSTTLAEADAVWTDAAAGKLTLTFTTADAVAREWLVLVGGDTAPTAVSAAPVRALLGVGV